MKHLIKQTLSHTKGSMFLFVTALTLILLVIPIILHSLQEVRSETESSIIEHARGSYDILLRGEGHVDPVEEDLGVVPENYVGFGEGGISLEAWEKVSEDSRVEIAAPVASLGYYTGLSSNYAFDLVEQSTWFETELYTSDGVNDFAIGDRRECLLLEADDSDLGQLDITFEPIYMNEELMYEELACNRTAAFFTLPATYHHVVAIDPHEEEMLTGIEFEDIHEDARGGGWGGTYRGDLGFESELIPIMELDGQAVSLETINHIQDINMDEDDFRELRESYQIRVEEENFESIHPDMNQPVDAFFSLWLDYGEGFYDDVKEDVASYGLGNERSFESSIGEEISPFNQDVAIVIDPHTGEFRERQDEDTLMMNVFNMEESTVYYTASPIDYEIVDDGLSVTQLGENNEGVPIYRDIEEHGQPLTEHEGEEEPAFIFDPAGEFSTIGEEESLASSPLGIYDLAPAYYVEEDEPVEMESTITPGSFVTPPASGVINVEFAELIKGEDPIDAIRVRVDGIDDYTFAAANKIEAVASDFEDEGFQVDIIAGSSPQHIEVDVEGVGEVRESWTTLGAAASIIVQWNMATLILGVAFLVVSFSYVTSRMRFWQVSKATDVAMYNHLGWEKSDQLKLFRGEIIVVWALASLLALPTLAIVMAGLEDYGLFIMVALAASITILVILMMWLKLMFNRVYLGENRKTKRGISKGSGINLKSVLYFRSLLMAPFIQVLSVSVLVPLVYLMMVTTVDQTNVTLLGDYVNTQIDGLQILIILAALVLTGVTLIESLSSLFIMRKDEIALFSTLGWKRLDILKHYAKEVTLWLLTSIVIGHIFFTILYTFLYGFTTQMLVVSLMTTITMYMIGLLIATLILAHYTKKYA